MNKKEIIIDSVHNYIDLAINAVIFSYDCIFQDAVNEIAEQAADKLAAIINENEYYDIRTDKEEILTLFPELPEVVEKRAKELNKFCD